MASVVGPIRRLSSVDWCLESVFLISLSCFISPGLTSVAGVDNFSIFGGLGPRGGAWCPFLGLAVANLLDLLFHPVRDIFILLLSVDPGKCGGHEAIYTGKGWTFFANRSDAVGQFFHDVWMFFRDVFLLGGIGLEIIEFFPDEFLFSF